ncbi:MAG: flagellar FliJ family protein [Planctomycetes bacterium]|nr:flagellar FliJ family protein [Planctomycetota bacterium]
MKRFAFRLQRLARVRSIEEQIAREKWALVERRARTAEETAERALADVHAGRAALRTELERGALVPAQLLQRQDACDALVQRRGAALQRARAARAEADVERAVWLGQKRKLDGLERLEERDHNAWRLAESASSAAEIDEIASVRAARKARLESAETRPSSRSFE